MSPEDKKQFFKDFMYNVRQMRKAQKDYFKARKRSLSIIETKHILAESKMYEKKIDDMLEAIDQIPRTKLPL